MTEYLDLLGTAVFAISGALAAGRKNMDWFGVVALANATAVGGGTLRDLVLDVPVFWAVEPRYIVVASVVALITIPIARHGLRIRRTLLLADACGLALFAVLGASKAMMLQESVLISVIMGVMSGVVGGVIRDVLSGDVPMILRGELYATAALSGAATYVAIEQLANAPKVAALAGILIALTLRLIAIRFRLGLPVFSHRD